MIFEWDPRKARTNLNKHGVTFDEASTTFFDPLSMTLTDPDHSYLENRLIHLGMSSTGRPFLVCFVDRGDAIRLISARLARSKERRRYEEASE